MNINDTLLVILAHPDDESFPIGGTLAGYAAQGVKVVLICATLGESGIPGVPPTQAGEIRAAELQCAADKLGIYQIRYLGYQDGTLSDVNAEELTAKLVKLLQAYQPQSVITFGPDGISGHPDHITISNRVTDAFDLASLPEKTRLFYLAPSEATLQGCGVTPSDDIAGGPVAGIDITDHRLAKMRAIQCHASQNPPFTGKPEEEFEKLACHEYFVLARPVVQSAEMLDLFSTLMTENKGERRNVS